MRYEPPPGTVPGPASRVVPRVYCAEDPSLCLADGTPLYLEWIIEGQDGKLYMVPAEPGGWSRRSPYDGQPNRLKQMPEHKAAAIACVTHADILMR